MKVETEIQELEVGRLELSNQTDDLRVLVSIAVSLKRIADAADFAAFHTSFFVNPPSAPTNEETNQPTQGPGESERPAKTRRRAPIAADASG